MAEYSRFKGFFLISLTAICMIMPLTVIYLKANNASINPIYKLGDIEESVEDKKINEIPITEDKHFTLGNGEVFLYKLYHPRKTINKATVSFDDCPKQPQEFNPLAKFVVLSNFMLFRKRDNLFIGGDQSVTNDVVEARVMEVVNALSHNLQHPLIAAVHILVKDNETLQFLQHLPLENSLKMVIKVVKGDITMNSQLLYAGNCLKGEIVAIAHQDNLFGAGFEKLQPVILQRKKIMYALTRHSSEISCSGSKGSANCDPGYGYLGSHDVFMFHVKEAFTPEMLKPMDTVTPNLYGMENVMIWMFKQKLGYVVINPCPILIVYHQHCVTLRDKGRRRVNTGSTTGWAAFTDKLDV